MQSEIGYALRVAMMGAVAGDLDAAYTYPASYQVALLSGGVEISGNGYARHVVCTGIRMLASWTRSAAVITVTVAEAHGLSVGDEVTVDTSSSTGAVTNTTFTLTAVTSTTFEFTGIAGGAASGTLYYTPDPDLFFWVSSDDADDYRTYTQGVTISWSTAASGGDWSFDEIRFIKAGTTGEYMLKFAGETATRVPDGDSLIIPLGTLTISDISGDVS